MAEDESDAEGHSEAEEALIDALGPDAAAKRDKKRRKKKKRTPSNLEMAAASVQVVPGTEVSVEMPAETPTEEQAESDAEEADTGGAQAGAAKKKKKKKKAGTVAEAPKEPAGKKPSAALAAIRQMQAAQKAAEALAQQEAALEAARIAEAEQLAAAETARLEEARLRRKERERVKKEELRKTGKLLTKSERERAAMDKLKLEQLLKAGHVVLSSGTAEDDEPKKQKRVVYTSSKKKKPVIAAGPGGAAELTRALQRIKIEDAVAGHPRAGRGADNVPESWEMALSDSEEESDSMDQKDSSSESEPEEVPARLAAKQQPVVLSIGPTAAPGEVPAAVAPPPARVLRSPICCVLGHVDTGKTKLLDKIRSTSVQEGEAGGITQQIGATYFPIDIIRQKTAALLQSMADTADVFRVPGLLVIDTPGHESFTNLRSRGSSLCNIAILVVDIMHGLEPQTLESIQLLKMKRTPFVVALNKIDRLYSWKSVPGAPFEVTFQQQAQHVQEEFETRLRTTKLAFAEAVGLNAELCFRNKDVRRTVSLIPTSAITGEGIPDLLYLIVSLTQKMMPDALLYVSTQLECTVLEVKVIEGLGTTIDVILSNGTLHEGDTIVVCGLHGPIITHIRALLTPQPLRELRVKSAQYVHHKEVRAALGVKVCAHDLERAVAGSRILLAPPDADEETLERLRIEVMADLHGLLNTAEKTEVGVCVQASTLGSLEALLSFLKTFKIPFCAIDIGPVYKKHVMRASVMLEHAKEYATILCFDVKVDKEAQELADELSVKIFSADIIYHLFDAFRDYMSKVEEEAKKALGSSVVFPVACRIVPGAVFNKKDPIVLGVDVIEGILKVGTPLCVIPVGAAPASSETVVCIGKVTSIECQHKPLDSVRKGHASVSIKVEASSHAESGKMVGRHFGESDILYSRLTRSSIDVLKTHFRKDLNLDDWNLVKKLKALLNIP